MTDTTSARMLGLTSLAVAFTELAAPRQLEQAMGIDNGENTGILRTLGVRELMHGIDILTHDDPTSGVWARVAGDVLDTALFAAAGRKTRRPGSYATLGLVLMAIGVADFIVAKNLSRRH